MAESTIKTILELIPSKDIPTVLNQYYKDVDQATKKASESAVKNTDKGTKEQARSWGDLKTAIAGAFAVVGVTKFTKEIVGLATESAKLALEAEGVERAFNRLSQGASVAVLEDLKIATQGTVSELELMKSAVQAKNFGIPLTGLGKLFAFAKQRAEDTGQAVDELTSKLVLGLGRRSIQILDDLGLTAVQLKDALGGVSVASASVGELTEAVGRIATKAMADAGEQTETTKVKIERLNATIADTKTAFGTAIIRGDAGKSAIESLTKSVEKLKDLLNDSGSNLSVFINDWVTGFAKIASATISAVDKITDALTTTERERLQTQKSQEERALETAKADLSRLKNLRLIDKSYADEYIKQIEIVKLAKIRLELTNKQIQAENKRQEQDKKSQELALDVLKKTELENSKKATIKEQEKTDDIIPLYGADISQSAFAMQSGLNAYNKSGEFDLLGGQPKTTFDIIMDEGLKLDNKQYMSLYEGNIILDESLADINASVLATKDEIEKQRQAQIATLNAITTGLNAVTSSVNVLRDPNASDLSKGASLLGTAGTIAGLIPGGQVVGAGLGTAAAGLTLLDALMAPGADEVSGSAVASADVERAGTSITRGSAYQNLNVYNTLTINSQMLDMSTAQYLEQEIVPALNELISQSTISSVA